MAIMTPQQREFLAAVARIAYCNPFSPERIEFERQALGPEFQEHDADWNLRPHSDQERVNADRITERTEAILEVVLPKLVKGAKLDAAEFEAYEDGALFVLYHRYRRQLHELIYSAEESPGARVRADSYLQFERDALRYLAPAGELLHGAFEPAHLFATLFQVRRAFHHIYQYIVGGSPSVARLRAEAWQSIFSHNMRRYRRVLFRQMASYTTLVTGPSGTGKELVARAIGLSRYIAFDDKTRSFVHGHEEVFFPVNLSALSPALVESELFGHKRGSFTGAIADHRGTFARCPADGTVFLDEIGELEPAIQIKLLRLLQSRTYAAVGDAQEQSFHGKIIAATNRDLAASVSDQSIREDFYYRICSDRIVTPSLADRLREAPEELDLLLTFIAKRLVGEAEADHLAEEVGSWIGENLGPGYTWPGNVRELEQCTQNVLIRGTYRPLAASTAAPSDSLIAPFLDRTMTAEEMLRRYCTWVYADCRSYSEVARRLELDRRTIKSKVDEDLLAILDGDS